MTKERLEELIKQEALVYTPTSPIRLHKNDRVCSDKEILGAKQGFYLVNNFRCFPLNKIYETEDQVEWRNKTYTERTERFEPPMWEEIKSNYEFNFLTKTGNIYKRILFYVSRNTSSDKIFIKDDFDSYIIFDTNADKENYIKACEMVRDLFKGEK